MYWTLQMKKFEEKEINLLIFDIKNWLKKYEFGTFCQSVIHWQIFKSFFPLTMLILGQNSTSNIEILNCIPYGLHTNNANYFFIIAHVNFIVSIRNKAPIQGCRNGFWLGQTHPWLIVGPLKWLGNVHKWCPILGGMGGSSKIGQNRTWGGRYFIKNRMSDYSAIFIIVFMNF